MSVFGVKKDYYYTVDRCNWRFIILNSCEEDASSVGGIGSQQMEWLEQALKTDKKVIISMHHSIWDKDTKEFIYPKFAEFEKIVSDSGRVEYVFSGHTHIDDYSKSYNGVEYHAIPGLSLGLDEKYSYSKKIFSLE